MVTVLGVRCIKVQGLFVQVASNHCLAHSYPHYYKDVLHNEETTRRPSSCQQEIELRGGSLINEGNIFLFGKPVCDDQWDANDAVVACRMLGYIIFLC